MSNLQRVEQLAEITFDRRLDKAELIQNFLEYALLCRDEEGIYSFMEVNQYGINLPEFWMARYQLAFRTRELAKAYEYLRKAKRVARTIKGRIFDTGSQQESLLNYLKRSGRLQTDDNDPFGQYDIMFRNDFNSEQHSKRKVGSITVYVDPQNRQGDTIDIMIKEYEKRCKQQIAFQRARFEAIQNSKPYSWLHSEIQIIEQESSQSDFVSIPDTNPPSQQNDINNISFYHQNNLNLTTPMRQNSIRFDKEKGNKKQGLSNSASAIFIGRKSRRLNNSALDKPIEYFRQSQNNQQDLLLFDLQQQLKDDQSKSIITIAFTKQPMMVEDTQQYNSYKPNILLSHQTPQKFSAPDPYSQIQLSLNKILQKFNNSSPCNMSQIFDLIQKSSQSNHH